MAPKRKTKVVEETADGDEPEDDAQSIDTKYSSRASSSGLPTGFQCLEGLSSVTIRHNRPAEEIQGRCSRQEYYEVISSVKKAADDESTNILLYGASRGHEFCFETGIPSVLIFPDPDSCRTKDKTKQVMRIQFETDNFFCPALPRQVKIFSPQKQVISMVVIHEPIFGNGNAAFDICTDKKSEVLFRATCSTNHNFQLLEYKISDRLETEMATVNEIGDEEFSLAFFNDIRGLNIVRLLGFAFVVEFYRKWQFKQH